MKDERPDIHVVLDSLGGGVFKQHLDEVLRDTAKAVLAFGDKKKVGKVVITLNLARIDKNSNNIVVSHSWQYSQPERSGKATRDQTMETIMAVNNSGDLTPYFMDEED